MSHRRETEHLILLQPKLADAPSLFEFLGDPAAMKFTHTDRSLKECRQRIAIHEFYRRKDGVAPWTVVQKTSKKIIGWGGLYIDPFDRRWGVEVGYYFHPDYWGHGFASELVQSSLEYAVQSTSLKELWAFAQPQNISSARVLEKSGFKIAKWVPEMQRNLYRQTIR